MAALGPVGQSALLVTGLRVQEARAVAEGARRASWPQLVDAVEALDSVLLVMAPGRSAADLDALAAAATQWCAASAEQSAGAPAGGPPTPGPGRPDLDVLELPCRWTGPDLDEVGRLSGLGRQGVVHALVGHELEVAFVGFAPGFPYLQGLPSALAGVPRRSAPRPAVPAGSVAVAGGFAGVYPTASPGGWQLIGVTDVALFDPARPPYAWLGAGQRVRFTHSTAAGRGEADPPGWPASAPVVAPGPGPDRAGLHGPVVLSVEDPGPATLVQDPGRGGFAHLGVPASGPVDPEAHELANRLVGNSPGAPALEVTLRGPVLRVVADTYLTVVGGGARPRLDGREVPAGSVLPLEVGQRLEVGTLSGSPRAVVAVAGGVAPARPGGRALGSVATDTLSGLGPPPLRTGDQLAAVGAPARPGGLLEERWDEPGRSAPAAPTVLRVLAGPHPEHFAPGALHAFVTTAYRVGPLSNRIGLRLVPPPGAALTRREEELVSQGMVTGAVQVPPDGAPVVLLADHATHGGYPVVAVVIDVDVALLGRLAPGAPVRFELVDPPTARGAWTARRRFLDTAVRGHYPSRTG